MTAPLSEKIGRHKVLSYVAAGCLVIVIIVAGFRVYDHGLAAGDASTTGKLGLPGGPKVCHQPILNSPYSYSDAAGSYASGQAGLPTYGRPGSDFPDDTAGVIVPAGKRSYLSYQLRPDTVYYLLPGVHVGSFMADRNDAFVGGLSKYHVPTVLSGDYSGLIWGIDSNFSNGNQAGVTIEYLTVEKYQPYGNAAAINQDSNTGWTIQYNTITLNVPGAGVILGADNTLKGNCLTLNGQYGFQSEASDSWGRDALTGGPYNINVKGNEISYNDTCDFEGLLENSSIGWTNHNPVPARYRNSHCGPVVPDGDQGGFKLWRTNGVTIVGNYIHNNWGPGGWADTDNANTTYTGNTITNNDGEAIIEEISYNFLIADNYIGGNGWPAGLANPAFPVPAIYISESGSDTSFGGVPACAEASCADQASYPSRSVISGNTMVDNGGNVFLWQSANRFCSDGSDSLCTLVRRTASRSFTVAGCRSNLSSASISKKDYVGAETGYPRRDWWDGCLWKTENVTISHNVIDFNPAEIIDCNRTDWPDCGAGGIFSDYGSTSPYESSAIPTQLTFFQHNSWVDNTYRGPSTFYAWNQGNGDDPLSWTDWTGSVAEGDMCMSSSELASGYCTGPFGQDAGSTYNYSPPPATAKP
jgi:hypothetical protein